MTRVTVRVGGGTTVLRTTRARVVAVRRGKAHVAVTVATAVADAVVVAVVGALSHAGGCPHVLHRHALLVHTHLEQSNHVSTYEKLTTNINLVCFSFRKNKDC